MSSIQRRRGPQATVYAAELTTDRRGNKVWASSTTIAYQGPVSVSPFRASKDDIPGQQETDMCYMIVPPLNDNVTVQSWVVYDGKEWDVYAPPAKHLGTRQTAHWTLTIRRRPTAVSS